MGACCANTQPQNISQHNVIATDQQIIEKEDNDKQETKHEIKSNTENDKDITKDDKNINNNTKEWIISISDKIIEEKERDKNVMEQIKNGAKDFAARKEYQRYLTFKGKIKPSLILDALEILRKNEIKYIEAVVIEGIILDESYPVIEERINKPKEYGIGINNLLLHEFTANTVHNISYFVRAMLFQIKSTVAFNEDKEENEAAEERNIYSTDAIYRRIKKEKMNINTENQNDDYDQRTNLRLESFWINSLPKKQRCVLRANMQWCLTTNNDEQKDNDNDNDDDNNNYGNKSQQIFSYNFGIKYKEGQIIDNIISVNRYFIKKLGDIHTDRWIDCFHKAPRVDYEFLAETARLHRYQPININNLPKNKTPQLSAEQIIKLKNHDLIKKGKEALLKDPWSLFKNTKFKKTTTTTKVTKVENNEENKEQNKEENKEENEEQKFDGHDLDQEYSYQEKENALTLILIKFIELSFHPCVLAITAYLNGYSIDQLLNKDDKVLKEVIYRTIHSKMFEFMEQTINNQYHFAVSHDFYDIYSLPTLKFCFKSIYPLMRWLKQDQNNPLNEYKFHVIRLALHLIHESGHTTPRYDCLYPRNSIIMAGQECGHFLLDELLGGQHFELEFIPDMYFIHGQEKKHIINSDLIHYLINMSADKYYDTIMEKLSNLKFEDLFRIYRVQLDIFTNFFEEILKDNNCQTLNIMKECSTHCRELVYSELLSLESKSPPIVTQTVYRQGKQQLLKKNKKHHQKRCGHRDYFIPPKLQPNTVLNFLHFKNWRPGYIAVVIRTYFENESVSGILEYDIDGQQIIDSFDKNIHHLPISDNVMDWFKTQYNKAVEQKISDTK